MINMYFHDFRCSLATAIARLKHLQVVQLILISGGGPTPLAPPVQTNDLSTNKLWQCYLKPLVFCGMKKYLHVECYA